MSIVKSKTFVLEEHPFAYITLVDLEKGKGIMQIYSDWGSYNYYWGSMGSEIQCFLLSADNHYVYQKLKNAMSVDQRLKASYGRLDRFMEHCWPRFKTALREESQRQLDKSIERSKEYARERNAKAVAGIQTET